MITMGDPTADYDHNGRSYRLSWNLQKEGIEAPIDSGPCSELVSEIGFTQRLVLGLLSNEPVSAGRYIMDKKKMRWNNI